MTLVSSKEFVSNESKYFDLALDEDVYTRKGNMTSITLEYDFCDVKAQKTLEYILSMGLFKPKTDNVIGKEETLSYKRKKLDNDLKDYMLNLSGFKFNRDEANIYDE